MRLGAYDCNLAAGSKARAAYGAETIRERHRHRYEFNNAYRELLAGAGLVASGTSPDGSLVEVCEIRDHPFMVGTQFHPELRSRPDRPHPLFSALVRAARERALDLPAHAAGAVAVA
jgi:CTP synthase